MYQGEISIKGYEKWLLKRDVIEPTLLLGKSKGHYPAVVVHLEKLIVLRKEGAVNLTPLDN